MLDSGNGVRGDGQNEFRGNLTQQPPAPQTLGHVQQEGQDNSGQPHHFTPAPEGAGGWGGGGGGGGENESWTHANLDVDW